MSVLGPVRIGTLPFKHPLVLGAGTCKTLEDIRLACARSAVSGVELGTITFKMRAGNEGKNFIAVWHNGVLLYTLNSLGMPNPGIENVTSWAHEAIRIAQDAGKLLGINIAGDTPQEIVAMVIWAANLGFDWITINAGCPNKWKLVNGIMVPEAILSFDTDAIKQMVELLEDSRRHFSVRIPPVWWKPSPENDTLGRLPMHTSIIGQSNVITGWVANNTVPHCYAIDPEDGLPIVPGGGLAGMGGPATKPKALGDLRQLGKLLPSHFTRVGSGGVTYGQDIIDHRKSGAEIVMFTSALWAANMDHRVAQMMLTQAVQLEAAA